VIFLNVMARCLSCIEIKLKMQYPLPPTKVKKQSLSVWKCVIIWLRKKVNKINFQFNDECGSFGQII